MSKLLELLTKTIDRCAIWFWLSIASLVLVILNKYSKVPSIDISRYGLIALFLFTALFLQSTPIHTRLRNYASGVLERWKEKKERKQRLSYILNTPCKEHAILVAYCDFLRNISKKNELDPVMIRSIFFDQQDRPTYLFRWLVDKGLARLDGHDNNPIIHNWVYREFVKKLESKKSNEAKRTHEKLKKYGTKLLVASEFSGLFVHSIHDERMHELEKGDA